MILLIEKIFPNLYKVDVILPQNPLKSVNVYIIKGQERNLIVDTGMNRKECINVIETSLKELKVDLSYTDFFITHMHVDHSGLVSYLKTDSSKIYCSHIDAEHINSMNSKVSWDNIRDFLGMNGFPEEELSSAINNHPGVKYCNREKLIFTMIKEGSTIVVGEYQFQCIATPGHTKGHMCLYEPFKKLLISGDHILHDITPNLALLSDDDNPLREYLKSLNKIYDLDVQLVLPGHRRLFRECKDRINELKKHHQVRSNEVLGILHEKPRDAYQIASKMVWNLKNISWNQFPPQQKLFATWEVLAHLKYLEKLGEVTKKNYGKKIIYEYQKEPSFVFNNEHWSCIKTT